MNHPSFVSLFAATTARTTLAIADLVKRIDRQPDDGSRKGDDPTAKRAKEPRWEPAQPILIVEDHSAGLPPLGRAAKKAGFINPLIVLPDDRSVGLYLDGAGIYADRKKYPFPAFVLQDVTLPRQDSALDLAWLRELRTCRHVVITDMTGMVEPRHFESAGAFGPHAILCKLQFPGSMAAMFRVLQRTCIEE